VYTQRDSSEQDEVPLKTNRALNFVYGIGMSFAWPLFPMVITHRLQMKVCQISTFSLASSTVTFGVASFIGSNVGGYIVDAYFNGIRGLNQGFFLSAALRAVIGLAYLNAHKSMKNQT